MILLIKVGHISNKASDFHFSLAYFSYKLGAARGTRIASEPRMLGDSKSNTSIQFENLYSAITECGKVQMQNLYLGPTVLQASETPRSTYINEKFRFEKHYFEKHFDRFCRLDADRYNQICSYMQLINQLISGEQT